MTGHEGGNIFTCTIEIVVVPFGMCYGEERKGGDWHLCVLILFFPPLNVMSPLDQLVALYCYFDQLGIYACFWMCLFSVHMSYSAYSVPLVLQKGLATQNGLSYIYTYINS